jgi:predicted Zn-dependent protease
MALSGACASALAVSVMALMAQAPAKDPLMQAMKDELERSRKITLNNLAPPYFIQYLVDESDNFGITATLGGIVSVRHDRFRNPDVIIRVGDYKLDNSNFAGGFGGGGARYDLERFPFDASYAIARRYFWLYTDSVYKSAVEALSRKQAALRNLQTEQLNDFAHAEPAHHLRDFQRLSIDEEAWTKRVRELSAMFARYPDVKNSTVDLESSAGGTIIVNTEGTETKEPENVTYLRVRAMGQAADGSSVRDWGVFQSLDPVRMPTDAEMTRGVTAVAENVTALAKAPKGEDYSGPVLFEGTAGAQIFAELLGKNLALTRRPVSEGGRGGGGFPTNELEGRIGARVLPDTFDVVDDPTQKEWHGRPLFGSYEVDREGVVPKPLRIVEKGVLKNYLLTRQPVHGFEGSNGRARLPGAFGAGLAAYSNLFVSSTDTASVADLKKKLLELCQARGKPYGIIVRKMDFPSSAPFDEARRILMGAQGGRPVSSPILVYKIFADGHEELVRGLRFRGLSARSLKDILAAGNDSAAFEVLENAAPFDLMDGAAYSAEACVVAPSILIDDLELHPVEDEQPKLPIVSPPGS